MTMETGCGARVWALHRGNLQPGVRLLEGTLGPFLPAFRNVKSPELLMPAVARRVPALLTA